MANDMAIDLKQFSTHLTYQTTASVSSIREDLTAIIAFDRQAEARQKRFNIILICSIIGGFVSCFLIAFVIGIVTLIGCVGVAIYAGIMLNKYKRRNLANYRYEVLQKILTMLDRDMERDAPVELTLVLSPPTDKTKKTQTTPHPHRSGWKIDHFRDRWLMIDGYFLDETQFTLIATELHITQYGWKRSRSGKSKYKTKSKPKAHELELTLTCPRRRYGAMTVLHQDARDAIQLPPSVRLTRFKLSDHRLMLATKTPPWTSSQEEDALYQTIAMMFLSLYQVLNLARLLTQSSGRSG